MFCSKCGCMYDERENTVCPACGGENQVNGNVNNADVYSNVSNAGVYGNVSNTGTYSNMIGGQAAMNNGTIDNQHTIYIGTQYQQYAGKYYAGLSKKDLFRFEWLKKYNISVMVLSILMYIVEAFMGISLISALATLARSRGRYGYAIYEDYIIIYGIALGLNIILIMMSILAHLIKSRVAAGLVMGFYILSIIGQFININAARYTTASEESLIVSFIILGLAVAVFILNIVYNSKWNLYRNTGIIPIR